ncbi:histidine kinase [Lentinula novae-zelandiae]|nr:histidine kinase [Lentinula novae-zelandiae]
MTCSSLLSYAPQIQSSPVGKLILEFDWSSTPLGPIEQWPQSLKTVVSIMLANPSQSCLFWGPDHILIYNNAWRRIISGSKHPHFMGKPGRIAFHEIWDTFSVHCQNVYRGKHVGRVDDLLFFDSQPSGELPLDVPGNQDDTIDKLESYFTWSYLPIQAEDGKVGGILNNCMETTEKVLSERRMSTVRIFAELTASIRTTVEFWQAVADSLALNEHDFPYFLCYSATNTVHSDFNSDSAETISNVSCDTRSEYSSSGSSIASVHNVRLDLVKSCGVQPGHPAAPSQVEFNSMTTLESNQSWPFSKACFGRTSIRAKNPHPMGFQARGWGDEPGDAILIPIHGTDDMLVGLVLFGLNTRRPYDVDYASFHQTLSRNLSSCYVATQAFERELQRTEELQALDRAKTVFFQNVSHELRTPLTLIRGPCEDALKDEDKLDKTSRARFKLIFRASGRLLRLVNSLMLFSSAEAKRLQVVYRPVRLGPVTADLASLFRSAIEKAGITYTIIFNLLSNAIKYTAEGFIKLSLRFHSSEVELRVGDSGCGIPEDQKELVLQRFHRVEYAEGRSHEGTGIGLALTSELVKLHGGRIKVESSLGKGSSFIISLPRGYSHLPAKDVSHISDPASYKTASAALAEDGGGPGNLHRDRERNDSELDRAAGYGSYAEAIVEEANGWLGEDSETASTLSVSSETGTDSSGALQPLCILLAEDNADARSYIKSILSTVAQVIIAVPDGRAALDYIRNQVRPDLIVTDVMMPGLTGTDLIQQLATDPDPDIHNIPIILLTARSGSESNPELKYESIYQGQIDYLLKPFSSDELVRRVRTRIYTVRQKLELERQVQQRTAELNYAQHRYRRMTELAPVAIFETDDTDRNLITFANERYFSLTGLPKSLPLRFDEIIESIEAQYRPAAKQVWSEILTGKPAQFEFQLLNGRQALAEMISLSSGSIRKCFLHHIFIVVGAHLPVVGTLTDQTDQRLFASQQLDAERQKTDEAVNRRRLQEAFIDIVSHELRNPISAILQSADLLSGSISRLNSIYHELFVSFTNKTEADSATPQKLFEEIRSELEDVSHAVASVELCARHQTIIASDILVVSRLDSNLLSINPTTFHLMHVLQNTLAMFLVQVETQSITLKLDPGSSITTETRIIADSTRLCQILVNLISNSCRALESWDGQRQISIQMSLLHSRPFEIPGHILQVTDPAVEASRIWVSFHISDTGPGVPVEDQARLFTRFNGVQAANANATRRPSSLEGTGLGLYLCRKLAELQGGAIKFIGAPGQGAAFLFFIEARLAENAPTVVSPHFPRPSRRISNKRYLVTDPSSKANISSQDHEFMKKKPEELEKNNSESIGNKLYLAEQPNTTRRAKIHILIVEDNAINQKLLRRQVEKAGFTAHVTNNGLEGRLRCYHLKSSPLIAYLALQYLEAAHQDNNSGSEVYPSLILMDLEMPILDGLEATARIRTWEMEGKLPGKLFIYAITGNARQGQIDTALAVGMDDVYIKPYNIADIIRRIDLDCQSCS